jgi:hypothetical protein
MTTTPRYLMLYRVIGDTRPPAPAYVSWRPKGFLTELRIEIKIEATGCIMSRQQIRQLELTNTSGRPSLSIHPCHREQHPAIGL